MAPFPPERLASWWAEMLEELASAIHTHSKGRSNPRVVKRRIKKFPSRKGNEILNQQFDWTPTIVK